MIVDFPKLQGALNAVTQRFMFFTNEMANPAGPSLEMCRHMAHKYFSHLADTDTKEAARHQIGLEAGRLISGTHLQAAGDLMDLMQLNNLRQHIVLIAHDALNDQVKNAEEADDPSEVELGIAFRDAAAVEYQACIELEKDLVGQLQGAMEEIVCNGLEPANIVRRYKTYFDKSAPLIGPFMAHDTLETMDIELSHHMADLYIATASRIMYTMDVSAAYLGYKDIKDLQISPEQKNNISSEMRGVLENAGDCLNIAQNLILRASQFEMDQKIAAGVSGLTPRFN